MTQPSFIHPVLLILLFIPLRSPGETEIENIDERCRIHAESITASLRDQVLQELTADQVRQMHQIIIGQCQARFGQVEHRPTIAEETTEEETDDWFSQYVLDGEPADKPGNRRLERMRRR